MQQVVGKKVKICSNLKAATAAAGYYFVNLMVHLINNWTVILVILICLRVSSLSRSTPLTSVTLTSSTRQELE